MRSGNGRGEPTAAKELRKAIRSQYEELFADLLSRYAPTLPKPEREYHFDASRNWRFDFAWNAQRVAVEIDGGNRKAAIVTARNGTIRAVAIGRHVGPEDAWKCGTATANGWRVLHVLPEMLTDEPERVIDLVCAALALDGEPEQDDHDPLGVYAQPKRNEFAR